ncbi:MAG: M20/M25/M40 family metallo-hydrolase [Bacteroidota bacterium]
MKKLFPLLFLISWLNSKSSTEDSLMLRKIYDAALTQSECYENLRYLCKKIGHRLSGSPQAQKAVEWGKSVMDRYSLDKVWLQEIMVPHWVRGSVEKGIVTIQPNPKGIDGKQKVQNIKLTALGGSVGTNGKMQAEIIEVQHVDELKALGEEKIKGKIVFFNRPFEDKLINTFQAYGGCVDQRSTGPSIAASYGAKAVLVRSMTHSHDNHPHTGALSYKDSLPKIPAAAVSTETADLLSSELQKGNKVFATLELSCKMLEDVKSYNVIGEIKGSEFPDQYITIGGHLDSWDIGEGAHDDGAGIVHSMEVLHLLKVTGYKPRHTIRVVLFMNEENGLRGGKKYAEEAESKKEKHYVAIESDRGGFVPRGFSVQGSNEQLEKIRTWTTLFKPYEVHMFEKGYGGADIGPLKKYDENILLLGFIPDSQRYFDHHHAETDVFESVNKRELELGAAAITAMVYLVDKYKL